MSRSAERCCRCPGATAGVVLGWLREEWPNLTEAVAVQFIRDFRDAGLPLGEAAALALLALWGKP